MSDPVVVPEPLLAHRAPASSRCWRMLLLAQGRAVSVADRSDLRHAGADSGATAEARGRGRRRRTAAAARCRPRGLRPGPLLARLPAFSRRLDQRSARSRTAPPGCRPSSPIVAGRMRGEPFGGGRGGEAGSSRMPGLEGRGGITPDQRGDASAAECAVDPAAGWHACGRVRAARRIEISNRVRIHRGERSPGGRRRGAVPIRRLCRSALRELGPTLTWFGLGLLGIGATLTALLVFRPAHKRLRALEQAARALGEGTHGCPRDEAGGDEVSSLARTFNHMAERSREPAPPRWPRPIAPGASSWPTCRTS